MLTGRFQYHNGTKVEDLLIKSAQGNYRVFFSADLSEKAAIFNEYKASHFVIDRNVFESHTKAIISLVDNRPMYLVDAMEDTKTLTGVANLCSWLQSNRGNRASCLVAIGGGITQDLVTFTSHVYYRGIPWIFYPTTLLSMCDSSIGAKCGINLNEFKNQLGVFQSPRAVFTCAEFLRSLSDFHIRSGYGEILKLHLTGKDWEFLAKVRDALKFGLRNEKLLELIKTSLEIKRQIIEEDEFETDLRRVLNYGHSFGHSLESVTAHEIPHGLAVAWGIDLINFIGFKRKFLSEERYQEVRNIIRNYLPYKLISPVSCESLINGARKDKKTDNNGINLIFLMDTGNLEIKKIAFDRQLEAEVSEYLSNYNVYAGH